MPHLKKVSRQIKINQFRWLAIFAIGIGAVAGRWAWAKPLPASAETADGNQTLYLPLIMRNYRPIVTLGMDTKSYDNTATTLGEIETCAPIFNVGEQLEMDLYVQDIKDLDAYQFRIGYDSHILRVTGVDTDFLLDENAGGVISDTLDTLPDTDGVLTLQSTDTSAGAGESGSGVLARVTFEAVAEGSSDIIYVKDAIVPTTPALFDTTGAAISDTDSDGGFDDHILLGRIEVGSECTQLPNLLMLGFQEGTDATTVNTIIANNGAISAEKFDPLDIYTVRIVSGDTISDTVGGLLAEPEVEFAESVGIASFGDGENHTTHPNDPEYTSPRAHQWDNLNVGQRVNTQQGLIDADEDNDQAWDIITDCRGPDPAANPIVIAVLDSGSEVTNPDLAGNIWANPLEGGPNDVLPGVVDTHGAAFFTQADGTITVTNVITDTRGHGSAVASVIGAVGNNGRELAGVCWTASILIVKTDLRTTSTVRALRYIYQLKQAGVDIRLVNGSYVGSQFSNAEWHWISKLGDMGVIFVAAAGNDGTDNDLLPLYPCAYNLDNIICAGASDNQDNIASFSNTGSTTVDLFAPGQNIRVLDVVGSLGSEIYTDADGSNKVSTGDTRKTPVTSGAVTYAVGSVVAGGDNDVNSPLRSYPASVKHDEYVAADNQFNPGEFTYIDNDNDNRVSAGDTRFHAMSFDGHEYSAFSVVRCSFFGPQDQGCGNALVSFNSNNEKYNSTRFINGTSFSAPNTTGMAALCWSLMPDRTRAELKDLILRFVDRKPAFEGQSVTGGRLRWPCGFDLGDAPPTYQTISREASTPELLECATGDNGPIHLDYTLEFFGSDVSQEHNANTPEPLDADLFANLGPGDPGTCPTGEPDSDLEDDGGFIFSPPPPWVPGQTVQVDFQVCSDVISGTVQFNDSAGGRYDAGDPDKRVYVTAWFDWNEDGTFTGEHTPLSSHEWVDELELSATATPLVPPPQGCVNVSRTFTALSDLPPWFRFRLDYGQHKGDNDPTPLFERDPNVPVTDELQIANFGEVEDYPLKDFIPPPTKISRPPTITPGEILTYTIIMPANEALTQTTDAWINDPLPNEVVFSPSASVYCNFGVCGYNFTGNSIEWNGTLEPDSMVVVVEFPVFVPEDYPPECPPITNSAQGFDGVLNVQMEVITTVDCIPP